MLDYLVIDSPFELARRPISLSLRVTASSAIEFTSPPWLPSAETRINYLLSLPHNWDGEGASPINFECAMEAISFLFNNSLHDTPAPQLVPTSAGGIQVEWHLSGIDFELRFDPVDPVTYFYAGANDRVEEGEVNQDLAIVGSLIRALPMCDERYQSS